MKKCNLIQNQPLPCQSFKEPLNPRTYTQNYTPHYDTRGDPLQIGGRDGQSSRPKDKGAGGGGLPKNFFRPFGPHFGPKIRGGRALWAPPQSFSYVAVFGSDFAFTEKTLIFLTI